MTVRNAFGVAGSAGRVAHHGRIVLVEAREVAVRRARGHELLVVDRIARIDVRAIVDDHDPLHCRERWLELADDRQERSIDHDEAIGRMIDDVRDLIVEQAGFQGV